VHQELGGQCVGEDCSQYREASQLELDGYLLSQEGDQIQAMQKFTRVAAICRSCLLQSKLPKLDHTGLPPNRRNA